jgi:hypothetical protein
VFCGDVEVDGVGSRSGLLVGAEPTHCDKI